MQQITRQQPAVGVDLIQTVEDESENDDVFLQEAYKKKYTQWLKVYATNHSLGSENQELRDLKNKAEGKVQQLEALVAKKDEKLKSVTIELERTQKVLHFLNNWMIRLDHLITLVSHLVIIMVLVLEVNFLVLK